MTADTPDSIAPSSALVVVGDSVATSADQDSSNILRGHGTLAGEDGRLKATVCGAVHRVNRLVTVQPLKTRYMAETGDVVVGRVTEVGGRRWKVEVGAFQAAALMLSAVSLPGEAQRRRTGLDELNMRSLYCEGDLISAEVQSRQGDGGVLLHTRSEKYGKVEGGMLVCVAPYLIRRMKHHFHVLFKEDPSSSVLVILGCNGFVWVGACFSDPNPAPRLGISPKDFLTAGAEKAVGPISKSLRERICRVGAIVRGLGLAGSAIDPSTITLAFEKSLSDNVEITDIASKSYVSKLATLLL